MPVNHKSKTGEVALDQLRTIDQARLGRAMGDLAPVYHDSILATLAEIFAR